MPGTDHQSGAAGGPETFYEAVRMLCDVTRVCGHPTGPSRTASDVLERVCAFDHWLGGRIVIVNDDGEQEVLASIPPDTPDAGVSGDNGVLEAINSDLTAEVLATNEPIWQRTSVHAASDTAYSAMCAPISSDEVTHGAMLLVARSRPPPAETIRRAIETVAVMFASVIERWRLERLVADAALEDDFRLGRELHEAVGQELATIALRADGVRTRLRAREDPEADTTEKLASSTRNALDRLRGLIEELVPLEMPSTGLLPVLRRLAHKASGHNNIRCDVRGDAGGVNAEVCHHLFRIVYEALGHATRHAGASGVDILIEDMGDRVGVEVRDERDGPNTEHPGPSERCMVIMRHHAALIDGNLSVRRTPDGGTWISCEAPKGKTDTSGDHADTKK